MATPNYGFEKRQKELAKRRKKEDKLKAKADRKTHPDQDDSTAEDGAPEPENGASAPGAPGAQDAPG